MSYGGMNDADVWFLRAEKAEAELAAARADVERLSKEVNLLTHKVITCGVAASHPDPNLTRTGAYATKWNSPQAEDVRALRQRNEELQRQNEELEGLLRETRKGMRYAGNDHPELLERIDRALAPASAGLEGKGAAKP